nr:MAG TPA: hypothetical protein [Caudoviricetes sp.]
MKILYENSFHEKCKHPDFVPFSDNLSEMTFFTFFLALLTFFI